MNSGIIKKAISLAEKSSHKQRVGAVIFKGNRILSIGYNSIRYNNKLHPKFKRWMNSLHAEQMAIINAHKNLRNASIFVVRLNRQGDLRYARPCEDVCIPYLKFTGIKEIFYSTNEGEIKHEYIKEI